MAEKTNHWINAILIVGMLFVLVGALSLIIHTNKSQTTALQEINTGLARLEQQVSTALLLRRDLVEEIEALRRDFCLAVNTGQCVEGK